MNTIKKHEGDLTAKAGVVYDFTEITGSLYARGADTKTAFPKLTTVGGSLDASGADTKTAFPKLTTVGGYLYASGADTKTAFPKLTTVGGSLDARGADTKTAFPKLTTQNAGPDSAVSKCRKALSAALALNSLSMVDGILSETVSKKGGVSRVIVVGQTKTSYIIERDGVTAHGQTLQLARADLLFKLGKRDTSAFKRWTLKTEKPAEEMIAAYRAITGACGSGTQQFITSTVVPKKLTVSKAIELTAGRFGNKEFSGFFMTEATQ